MLKKKTGFIAKEWRESHWIEQECKRWSAIPGNRHKGPRDSPAPFLLWSNSLKATGERAANLFSPKTSAKICCQHKEITNSSTPVKSGNYTDVTNTGLQPLERGRKIWTKNNHKYKIISDCNREERWEHWKNHTSGASTSKERICIRWGMNQKNFLLHHLRTILGTSNTILSLG